MRTLSNDLQLLKVYAVIFVILLQPIVISNNPLIKAVHISLESPIDENKKQNM